MENSHGKSYKSAGKCYNFNMNNSSKPVLKMYSVAAVWQQIVVSGLHLKSGASRKRSFNVTSQ